MFKRDEIYKDGNGLNWRVVCVDAPGDYPIVAVLVRVNPLSSRKRTYTEAGQYDKDDPSTADLIPPKRRIKGWVLVNKFNKVVAGYSYKPTWSISPEDTLHEIDIEL